MRKYRIAFFTADWNYELVETTLHGLKKYVQHHDNVRLCVFDCFGKDTNTLKDRSEYAIYDLVDMHQFDGVLIQSNQIVLEPVRKQLEKRARAAGIPSMTIDCPLAGCTLIGIDNEQAQYDMAEHVIRHHGARTLVYLTGLMENGCPEGMQRRDGFLRACRDNGIPAENIQVFQGTWRTSDGYQLGKMWFEEGRPLPDAFVCANDEMALGLMEALEEHGIHAPRDLIVVGFDDVSSAELSRPRVSTVRRDQLELCYYALDRLIAQIDGEEHRPFIPFHYTLLPSESCGCPLTAQSGYIRDKYFKQIRFLKNFYGLQDDMAQELFETDDLLELAKIVVKHKEIFGCQNIYMCYNDYYFDNYDKKQWGQNAERYGTNMVLAGCDLDGLCSEDGQQYLRFPTKLLLPGDLPEKERFLVFYPLHYNTYSIGFLAMNDISQAAKLNLHKSIFSFLEIAIENVRKKRLLRQFNEVLDSLYIHDGLTSLYNRFGYGRFGQQTFDTLMQESGGVQILFIDMDNLKTINDTMGHQYGDTAIRDTARLLRECCWEGDFLMRFGGDEFLVIASVNEEGLEEKIQSAIRAYNEAGANPFQLSVSIGVIPADAQSTRSLESCVQAADALMYRSKSQKKRQRADALSKQ
ncbi:MAG: GGDEF domain-containing protein [Clostridia bacterium]|nr:GGDEF domain-containing protein [Clostridia bacterium]